ncbi:cation:proton antiporter [Candidatus Uhrbacteria bacterium]|nr:cation:proton antiporter [Candidatus Uhrbacteria bacterium]
MDIPSEIISRISILLALAVCFCILAKKIRQPLMIAYLFAGLFAGPLALGLFSDHKDIFETFSQIGIVLLLFVIGLSLNVTHVKKIGAVALVSGVGQFLFTAVLGTGMLYVMGFPFWHSFYIAVAITFSSTIIITKLLSEKKHTDTLYGRHTIGLMLVQDIIAVVVLLFLGANQGSDSILFSSLHFILTGLALVCFVALVSRTVLPVVLEYIAQSQEFLFVFSLFWCFSITVIAQMIGFSTELGALIAGVSLSSSIFQPAIAARVKPLRDFFLVLFFVILGAHLTPSNLSAVLLPAAIISLFILIGNPFILYLIFRAMKFTRRNAFMAGITAAQVSEFGFIVMALGQKQGIVGDVEIALFTLVALCTIFFSSYLVMQSESIYTFLEPYLSLGKKERFVQKEEGKKRYDVWVIGYHRIGWKICAMLKKKKISFAVIDFDPLVIAKLQNEHVHAFYGDVHDVEFLSHVGIHHAKLVISTIPDPEHQITLLHYMRSHTKRAFVIANAPEAKYMNILYSAGANYVMTPHLLGGGWIAKLIEQGKMTKKNLEQLRKEQSLEISLGLPIESL